jgi:integrase
MRRVIKPVATKLRMPWLGWHTFRHTHSTLAEELQMALSDRQAQMGHSDYRMTLHYIHSDMERRRRTLDVMANRLTGTPESDANLTLMTTG